MAATKSMKNHTRIGLSDCKEAINVKIRQSAVAIAWRSKLEVTEEYYDALGSARYLITDTPMPRWFRPGADQIHLVPGSPAAALKSVSGSGDPRNDLFHLPDWAAAVADETRKRLGLANGLGRSLLYVADRRRDARRRDRR